MRLGPRILGLAWDQDGSEFGPGKGCRSSAVITIFRNARVFDGRSYQGDVGDVVIDDGVMVAGGGEQWVWGAMTVDAAGGLLSPGFVDAHVHAVGGGLDRLRWDLSEVDHVVALYVDAIAAHAAANPRSSWVLGGGWAMAAFPEVFEPPRCWIKFCPIGRSFVPNRDRHSAWVNSRHFRSGGVSRTMPDPDDGRIERDADANLTGIPHQGAMAQVRSGSVEGFALRREGPRRAPP